MTPTPPNSAREATDLPWWSLTPDETLSRLGVEEGGLSSPEAAQRLERYGSNLIRAGEVDPWWRLLIHQFTDPLIYILLAAVAVSIAIEDYIDAGVILTVVLLNALIGFVQEYRAREAMRALSRLGAPQADVMRDGVLQQLPAAELVPGDIVLLESGGQVPADLRLLRTVDLAIDESALTGESVPSRKEADQTFAGPLVAGDQGNLAFATTMVTRGRGRGVVVRTGPTSEVGRIAEAVHAVGGGQTPLQESVRKFGTKVGVALVGLSGIALVLGLLHGMGAAEIFMTAVAMGVSAVPEGLPVVLTVTLAVGVQRMARRRAVIRSLPAVETLGSTTVIASDKTGTLTLNQMTVRAIWAGGALVRVTGEGYGRTGEFLSGPDPLHSPHPTPLVETLRAGVLANEADARITGPEGEPLGDPTEVALLVAAAKGGIEPERTREEHPEVALLPFEPELRYMAVVVEDGNRYRIWMKGAPEAVLERCDRMLTEEGAVPLAPEAPLAAQEGMASEGLRLLAMAYREVETPELSEESLRGGFILCGIQGMEDPVRPGVVEAIQAVRGAGVRVLMLTGDHLATARTIGAQLGLGASGARAIEGRELADLSDAQLDGLLGEGVEVFARVAPEHKLRVVERLRSMGEVVAVTGDGVNDAPALRAAHIGIAMGIAGTDVAREASDMVLQDDHFATIRAAVEEGRIVFANVRKVTFFLLSTAVGEVITLLVALAAGWPLPFVAAQILWINLVTNGLQDVALAVEPGEPGIMEKRPRKQAEGILSFRLMERLAGVGVVLAVGTLGTFWWTLETTGDLAMARTMAMTQMVVFQFFHLFNCRALDRSIFRIPLFSNPFLFLSLMAALLAQLAVLYWTPLQTVFRTVPLDLSDWFLIVAVGSTVILGGELDKALNLRRARPIG